MEDKSIQLLCELSNLHACPSGEHSVRGYLKEKYDKVADEIVYDNLGGIFGIKHSRVENAPKLMMAGHMDEVGFMVISITPNGMLRLKKLGGSWENALLAQRVYVHVKSEAVVGLIVPWDSQPDNSTNVSIEDVVVDIGAVSDSEVNSWGVFPGQLVTYSTEAVVMKNSKMLMGKAWDDRAGCAMGFETMAGLADEELGCHLITGGTVQEEGGRRGAETAANLIKPDFFFALEGPLANDISGNKQAFGRLGDGVLFRIIDRELKLSPELRDFFLDIAHTHKIPYQFYVSTGGTDAGLVQKTGIGVLTAVIAVAARTRHSAQSIIHIDDYHAAVEFLKQFTRAFDRSVFESLLPRP